MQTHHQNQQFSVYLSCTMSPKIWSTTTCILNDHNLAHNFLVCMYTGFHFCTICSLAIFSRLCWQSLSHTCSSMPSGELLALSSSANACCKCWLAESRWWAVEGRSANGFPECGSWTGVSAPRALCPLKRQPTDEKHWGTCNFVLNYSLNILQLSPSNTVEPLLKDTRWRKNTNSW